jgi:uncharacterized protein (DUF2249 family)
MIKDELIITPKTKVYDIITTYPQLESVLVGYVPTFEKLKNPILRRTVAKITNLQQAAQIGEVSVVELVNHLREQIGQNAEDIQASESEYNYKKTAWFDAEKIVAEFDVREMLAAGDHPVAQVMEDLKKLKKGQIYKMIAPFLPIPLIDKASGLGFAHWIDEQNEELFNIYFLLVNV